MRLHSISCRRKFITRCAAVALPVLLCMSAAAAPPKGEGAHDGEWWSAHHGTYRNAFVVGYLEASVDNHANGIPANIDLSLENARVWVQGLDQFYSDFRNQNILVDDALRYVHRQLNGATDEQLAAMLSQMRQQAAARSGDN